MRCTRSAAPTKRAREMFYSARTVAADEAQARCLTSDYHVEAIARFAGKEPPKFRFK